MYVHLERLLLLRHAMLRSRRGSKGGGAHGGQCVSVHTHAHAGESWGQRALTT